MSVKLTTNLSQRLVLTPQLRQRIEMLQMTTLELSDLIQQQLLENPVLEEVPTQEETQELAEKILDQLANGDSGSSFDITPAESSAADVNGASSNGTGETDAESLSLSAEGEAATMEAVSGEANEEIAAMGGWSDELVEEARQVVMRLDPVGCGARDVRECLLVQLETRGESERLAAHLIGEHLPELQQHKLPNLSKLIGVDVETLLEEVQFIRTLDPYPGRPYSTEEPVLIAPEIYIEKLDDEADEADELGGYVIYFGDDGSPRLRISQSYQQMLSQQQTTKETRDFIRDKMRSAVDLLRNIEHRRQTIYKVVESIIK